MTTLWCLGRGDEQNRERGCLNDGARVRRVEDVAHVHGDAPLDARRHGTRVQHLRIRVITINAGESWRSSWQVLAFQKFSYSYQVDTLEFRLGSQGGG